MAAPIFTLVSVPIIAGTADLTALTGGNGNITGYTGADWTHRRSDFFQQATKQQGGKQLVFVKDTSSNVFLQEQTYWPVQYENSDADFPFGGVGLIGGGNQAVAVVWNSTFGGAGFTFSIAADQTLRTIRGIWALRNGLYRITATLADGSAAPLALDLPNGVGYYTVMDAWWQCQIRTRLPTTVNFLVERVSGLVEIGSLLPQITYLPPPALPARPTSVRRIATYQGKFGGRS